MRRIDYKLIEDLVPEGATVLDLACGDGELLSELIAAKGVRGSGVEVSQEAVRRVSARDSRCSMETWTRALPTSLMARTTWSY